MENITSPISVQVDSQDKETANSILKSLGLNMRTFVNMAIKQLIYVEGLPFEVKRPKPTKELEEALKESNDILEGKTTTKGYNNIKDLMRDLKNDWTNNKIYNNCYECHIEPDWLLIYQIKETELILVLVSIGSHSNLFR